VVTLEARADKLSKFAECIGNLNAAKEATETLKVQLNAVNKIYSTLAQYKVSIPNDDLALADEMREKKDAFILKTKACEKYITTETDNYAKDLSRKSSQLDAQVQSLSLPLLFSSLITSSLLI